MKTFVSIIISLTVLFPASLFAVEVAPRISDREIIESLATLKQGQKDLNARFDDLRTDMNKRFDSLQNIMIALFSSVMLVVIAMMGMLMWDRKTSIKTVMKIEYVLKEFAKTNEDMAKALRACSLM